MAKKILIIEDEITLQKVLADKFKKEGYEVIQEYDGKKGLEAALESKPDLILLDIIMPLMDGMTMLKELRKNKEGKKIPVILLTNLSDPEKAIEATKVGVYDYLIKSDWKIEELVKVVNKKLSK